MLLLLQTNTDTSASYPGTFKISSVNPASYMQISYRLSAQGCLGRTRERKRQAEYATNMANVFGEYCAIKDISH